MLQTWITFLVWSFMLQFIIHNKRHVKKINIIFYHKKDKSYFQFNVRSSFHRIISIIPHCCVTPLCIRLGVCQNHKKYKFTLQLTKSIKLLLHILLPFSLRINANLKSQYLFIASNAWNYYCGVHPIKRFLSASIRVSKAENRVICGRKLECSDNGVGKSLCGSLFLHSRYCI